MKRRSKATPRFHDIYGVSISVKAGEPDRFEITSMTDGEMLDWNGNCTMGLIGASTPIGYGAHGEQGKIEIASRRDKSVIQPASFSVARYDPIDGERQEKARRAIEACGQDRECGIHAA